MNAMPVFVKPLLGECISKVIDGFFGPILTGREAEVLDYCQTLGEVYTGYVDGEFVCCWGLIPPSFLSNQAYLWMWAPEKIKHQFIFVRQSQLQIEKMLQHYDAIVGHCKTSSTSAHRWLKWLGAEFDPPRDGVMPFVIRRHANG